MKKVLFISGIQIFPPESGGQLRSANICRALAKLGLNVEVYSFTGRKKDYLNMRRSSETNIIENVREYTNRNPLFGLIQFFFYHLSLPPLWLTWLTKHFIPKNLKQKILQSDFIILDFPYLYPLSIASSKPIFLNTHNAEFELFQERSFLSKLVKEIEHEAFLNAEHIFFCNSTDQSKYLSVISDLLFKSSVLPNGVELSDFSFTRKLRDETRQELNISKTQNVLLFTGSQYTPNKEAFEFLQDWSTRHCNELLKFNIVILVVGTVSLTPVDTPYLKVIGRVDNIGPYLAASDFGINPIVLGSGTNVKMIEFLAAQLPILSTAFGARGLNLEDQQTCWFFKRDQFLEIILEAIMQNSDQRKRMAKKALQENLDKVDMFSALRSLNIQW